MPRTILVVDDNDVNRLILHKILSPDYAVLEADNGRDAEMLLLSKHQLISGILLDIMMPVMDGYELLARRQANPVLSQIPVIVITSATGEEAEKKALALGANDYVTKPFNADIIKRRLDNLIRLRETSAMVNAFRRDKLTGLWNRETFFEKAAWQIARKPEGYYVLSTLDIDNFKVINDQYGAQKGDEVLKQLAHTAQSLCDANGGLCSRFSADHFVTLYPRTLLESDAVEERKKAAGVIAGLPMPVTITTGRYVVDDKTLSVSAMYDRAAIAQATVKGLYNNRVATYNETMRDHILREQRIVNEMTEALAGGQFEPWFQPQYNHATGALIGAEALVRWRHPRQGLIPPGEFIPVFERNGFIYELDKYIWERVCQCLRRWLDEGRSPLPISVNVSRGDLFHDDLLDEIVSLTQRYAIAPELLRLEITESAFAQSAQQVVSVVKRLIERGFTIEIDDFGSGYSSLNTLKDVPAQILKLDMRFFEKSENSDRGGNIVESIVRMAKWLDMSVIAEGVEEREQADYLKSVGCNYVQGYLYAKPITMGDYEKLAKTVGKEQKLIALETAENLDNNTFWNPGSMDTLIFNSYVGAACIFEYHQGKIELIRANDKYTQTIGSTAMQRDSILKLELASYLNEEDLRKVSEAIERSLATKQEVTNEFVFWNLPGCPEKTYLRSTLRVIATAGEHCLVYCGSENITAQRLAEQKEHVAAQQLMAIMQNVDGGVSAVTIDEARRVRIVFANERYYSLLGYTREQFNAEVDNAFDLIYPEDREETAGIVKKLIAERGSAVYTYRCLKRDGSLCYVRCHSSVTAMEGVGDTVLIAINADITQEREAFQRIQTLNENLQNLMSDTPGGFARMRVLPNGSLATVYVNDYFCRLRGMTRERILASDQNDAMLPVHPDDAAMVRQNIAEMTATGKTCRIQYRLRHADGSYVPFVVFGRVSKGPDGERYVNAYFAEAMPEGSP